MIYILINMIQIIQTPIWKAKLKSIVGYERIELEVNELIWQGIVRHFFRQRGLKNHKEQCNRSFSKSF